ncbi:MAG TPA: DoxX family protein [Tepidisphaeraceae bacterium]|jgi:putative oxidoreductase|nr:DoxX family protein [Tepidisphaeraceae bacterium]
MGALNRFLFGGPGTATSLGDLGLLVTRLGFGAYIALHGYGKLVHDDGIYIMPKFIEGVQALHFPAPMLFAWMATLTELVGGLLIAIGFMTRPMAFALVFNMCVASFLAMKDAPWFDPAGGTSKELPLLYLMFFILLLLIGSGRFAVEAFLRKSTKIVLPKRTDQ